MKRKGFTLVELLAIIVILAIIAVISVPMMTNFIESSRKKTFKSSVIGLMEAGDVYRTKHSLDYNEDGKMIFTCKDGICINEKGNELTYKGQSLENGELIIYKDGKIEANYLKTEYYCAVGESSNLVVDKDCAILDTTAPELTLTKSKVTKNEITIHVKAIESNDSLITEIQYSIDGKKYIEEYEQQKVEKDFKFENLESEKEYKIVVTAKNKSGKEIRKELTVKTIE